MNAPWLRLRWLCLRQTDSWLATSVAGSADQTCIASAGALLCVHRHRAGKQFKIKRRCQETDSAYHSKSFVPLWSNKANISAMRLVDESRLVRVVLNSDVLIGHVAEPVVAEAIRTTCLSSPDLAFFTQATTSKLISLIKVSGLPWCE